MEVDGLIGAGGVVVGFLSTHDLTWRSTSPWSTNFEEMAKLSTHDLTWRSTVQRALERDVRKPFNSRPHMEVD